MTKTLPVLDDVSPQFALPVNEVFASVQGEGHWCGTAMTFIRMAGCTVGKPYTPAARGTLELASYQEMCTDWNGQSFACDTNYRLRERLTVAQIMALPEIGQASRVCLTGGEPLMHKELYTLVEALHMRGIIVHLETSGTIEFNHTSLYDIAWVAVSPKQNVLGGMLKRAGEIKILVGDGFNEDAFVTCYERYFTLAKVWVQPVNFEHELNQINVQRCIELVKKYHGIRLSTQMHKVWRVR